MMNHLLHLKTQDRIGWIGLGEMGYNMANNLQRYLASLHLTMTVWNRSPAKSAKMHSHGAHVAKSLEDLVAQSNIIFTSLASDAAVEEIYSTLLELASQVDHPIIFVETSTIYPTLATKISQQVASLPQKHIYLQCPVFGRPPVAKAAKLIWVTSGDEKAIKKMCLYFTTMSRSIIHLKTLDVAKACNFKLIGNFFVVGSMELLAEGLTLAEKSNVDQESVLRFVDTFFPAPSWTEYSRKMVNGQVTHKEANFSVDLGLKDVGHMRQLAQDSGAALPTADLAYRHLKAVQAQGKGDEDWSSLINTLRSASALPSVVEQTVEVTEKDTPEDYRHSSENQKPFLLHQNDSVLAAEE
jgi:3-hydroxyisobutyrate dehydrogenase-like beta-hydroxyacid dehydrogenase